MKLKIDDKEYPVTNVAVASRNKSAEESDYGRVIIKTDEPKDFKVYSKVQFTNFEDGYLGKYVIQGMKPVQKGYNYYEYEIELTENIDYFTQVFPVDRKFSRYVKDGELQYYTIKDILEIYVEELEFYKGIEITFDEDDEAYETRVPELDLEGKHFKEVLKILFDEIDSIPRMRWYDDKWFLDYETYADWNNEYPFSEAYQSFQSEQQNSEYGTYAFSQVKNAVNTKRPAWHPSKSGYIHPRSENRIYRNSEAFIPLPHKAAEIDKVILVDVPVNHYDSDTGDIEVEYEDVDVTSQLVTSKQFEILEDSGDTEQFENQDDGTPYIANAIVYDVDGKSIYHLYTAEGGILDFWNQDVHVLHNAAKTAWLEQNDTDEPETDGPNNAAKMYDVHEWKVRVQFKARKDIDMEIERQDVKGMTTSALLVNQESSSVDIGRYAKNLDGVINRVGNRIKQYSYIIKSGKTLPQLGDYEDNWICSYIRYQFYANQIKVDVQLTKNHNNLKAAYGIFRDPSVYTISQKTVRTNIITKTIVELSKENKNNTDVYLTEKGRDSLLRIYGADETAHLDVGAYSSSESGQYIHLDVSPEIKNRHIMVNTQFDHPTLAGYSLIFDGDTAKGKPIRYTDREGRVQRFNNYIGSGLDIEDDYDLPYMDNKPEDVLLDFNNLPVRLDSNAIWAHTHVISNVTDDADDIIVGFGFSELNNMVNGEIPDITIYKSDKPFNLFDSKVREDDSSDGTPDLEYDSTQRAIRLSSSIDKPHWCIADEDGHILHAFNNTGTEWLYFNFFKI